MRGSIKNISQQKALQSIDHYNALFHPSYLNNYNIELVNRSKKLDTLIAQKKSDLQKLNIASFNLCAFCKVCIEEMRQLHISSPQDIAELSDLLNSWEELIKLGNSFATYDYAKAAIEIITASGFPFLEKIYSPKYAVILEAFKAIPQPAKAFIRLNNYSVKQNSYTLLSSLFDFFTKNLDVFHFVERMEISKDEMTIDTPRNEEYPAFSIFFDYNDLSNRNSDIINKVIDHIMFAETSCAEKVISSAYAFQVTRTTTLSQGYKNYKRYLQLMDILNIIYNKDTNYAFIND